MSRAGAATLFVALALGLAVAGCKGGKGSKNEDAGPDDASLDGTADAAGASADGDADGPTDGVDGAPDAFVPPEPDECGDVRWLPRIFYGTLLPRYVPLSPGQVLAVGDLPGCSGTLVTPRWVLTADHCDVRAGDSFCMGDDPGDPDVCLDARRVVPHPGVDLTLVELEADATESLPGVEPIAPMTEALDASWIGRTAEAAGYGDTESGLSGTRKFVVLPIVDIDASYVAIDGGGERGVCFGDSGGPLLVVAADGTVRVAGALSEGDDTCLDVDWFARADAQRAWIEEHVGPVAADTACGVIDRRGRCFGDLAVWCGDGGERAASRCVGDEACGYSATADGFRCIAGDDPCDGLDGFGRCEDGVARWCRDGEPRSRDCGRCGQVCAVSFEAGGAYCIDDPCMGLDYYGRCNGDVVEWCDDGVFRTRDCAEDGERCAHIDEDTGYYCE